MPRWSEGSIREFNYFDPPVPEIHLQISADLIDQKVPAPIDAASEGRLFLPAYSASVASSCVLSFTSRGERLLNFQLNRNVCAPARLERGSPGCWIDFFEVSGGLGPCAWEGRSERFLSPGRKGRKGKSSGLSGVWLGLYGLDAAFRKTMSLAKTYGPLRNLGICLSGCPEGWLEMPR